MIIRKIDNLGRIVIPKEMRRTLKIKTGDYIEISDKGSNIILHKYEEKCNFCGNDKKLIDFKGKRICKNCLRELKIDFFGGDNKC